MPIPKPTRCSSDGSLPPYSESDPNTRGPSAWLRNTQARCQLGSSSGRTSARAIDSTRSGVAGRASSSGSYGEKKSWSIDLAPGDHIIVVKKDGYQTVTQTVDVKAGDNPVVRITLVPNP